MHDHSILYSNVLCDGLGWANWDGVTRLIVMVGLFQVISQILNRAQGLLLVGVAVAATARRVRMKKTRATVAILTSWKT